MSSLDDIPFDLGGTESETEDTVLAIFDTYGFSSWGDVFVAWENQDPSFWRTIRFETAEEALLFAHSRRILPFTRLVYYGNDALPYGWVVGNSI